MLKTRGKFLSAARIIHQSYGPSFPVDKLDLSTQRREIIPTSKMAHLHREAPVQTDVIGVHASDKRRPAEADRYVQRVDQAGIALMEDVQARVPPLVLIENFSALIRRSVVDGNAFKVAKILRQNAVQRSAQKTSAIVDGKNDAERRKIGSRTRQVI
jgi:hypothetical protein